MTTPIKYRIDRSPENHGERGAKGEASRERIGWLLKHNHAIVSPP